MLKPLGVARVHVSTWRECLSSPIAKATRNKAISIVIVVIISKGREVGSLILVLTPRRVRSTIKSRSRRLLR